MANQLSYLLEHWYPQRDACEWVLGTVYKTEGASYRKAGAMMLFNSKGQQFGMLSGGCLESDIHIHARQVMDSGRAQTLCYDGSDEDDLSFQLGIGCGGTVYIMLQKIHENSEFLQLDKIYHALQARQSSYYSQHIPTSLGETVSHFSPVTAPPPKLGLIEEVDSQSLVTKIDPDPHLLVVGGGMDARPLVSIAHELGWYVSVWDSRPANARREFFLSADKILNFPVEALHQYVVDKKVNAAVLMTHNIFLDAQALQQLHQADLQYLALLGPVNRRDKVFKEAQLNQADLSLPLAAPAGLDLGGELPEGIALSILAECHARLKQCEAASLSGLFSS